MSKQVVILRGVPGAGKSHYIKKLVSSLKPEQYQIHSTDHYFVSDGVYRFDKTKLQQYHHLNQQAFKQSLNKEVPLVICDNTNIKRWQYQVYADLAKAQGYQVSIKSIGLIKTLTEQPQHFEMIKNRNQHQVEDHVYTNML